MKNKNFKKIKHNAIRKSLRIEKWQGLSIYFKITISVLILFLLIWIIYATFFYFNKCGDETCFLNYLKDCNRATYSKQGDFSMFYSIKGYVGSRCVVEAQLVDVREEINLRQNYFNSEMECYIPFSKYYYPENDLNRCSGLLKEGLQEILILRLKNQIVNNIDDLNLDILN